jgi:V8-like Glu-specific endopeptidase
VIHRSIGALAFRVKNKQLGGGTGFLISKNLVLTAAHNIRTIGNKNDNTPHIK